jgi:hypothetical protein
MRMVSAQWDRVVAVVSIVAAITVFGVGSHRLSHSPYGPEELSYLISAGLGAMSLLAGGIALLMFADLRDKHLKLRRLRLASGTSPADREGGPVWRGASAGPALWVAGTLLIVAGWRRASTTADLYRALDGLAIAGAGLALGILALTASVAMARRRLRCVRNEIVRDLSAIAEPAVAAADTRPDGADDSREWTAPGLRRFHRRSCDALRAKLPASYTVPAQATGLEPCLLCHPDAPS